MFFKAKNDKSSKSPDLPPDKKIVQSKAKKNERKAGKTVAESPVAAKVKGSAVSGTSKKAELVNSTKEKAEASNKKVSDFAAERKTSDQTQNRISESDAASQAADEAIQNNGNHITSSANNYQNQNVNESAKNNTDNISNISNDYIIQSSVSDSDEFSEPVINYRNDLFEPDDDELKFYIHKIKKEMNHCQWAAAFNDSQRAILLYKNSPIPYLYFIAASEPIGNIYKLPECSVKNGLSHYKEFQSALMYSNDEQKEFLYEANINSMYNYVQSQIVTLTDKREKFILITSQYRHMLLFINNNTLSENIRNKGLAFMYSLSCEALANIQTYNEAEHCSYMFDQISEYQDSAKMAEKCYDIYSASIIDIIHSEETSIATLKEKNNELSFAHKLKNYQQLQKLCQEKIGELKEEKNNAYINQRYQKSQERNARLMKILCISFSVAGAFVALGFAIAGLSTLNDDSDIKLNSNAYKNVNVHSGNDEHNTIPVITTDGGFEITTQKTTDAENEATPAEPLAVDTTNEVKQALQEYMETEAEQNSLFALFDINADGIKELFIQCPDFDGGTSSYIYLYKNGKYEKSFSFGNTYINLKDHLIMEKVYTGGETTKLYSLTDGEILLKDELKVLYNPETYYFHNDSVISEDDYNNFMSEYSTIDWVSISYVSSPVSALIDTSIYTTTTTTQITTTTSQTTTTTAKVTAATTKVITSATQASVSTTQTAASTTQTVTTTTINNPSANEFIATGRIVTENDPLNLRAAPDSNAEIVYQIPKGEYVGIYSVHGNWLYVKYYNDNIPNYYGYVSKDYVDISWLDTNNTPTTNTAVNNNSDN